ncbi:MAG: ATP-binding cassette domain-containing protein [Clostridia bacterium]|nr:ATP-binding cassette domain-containing protein [Clostridia bacterium]
MIKLNDVTKQYIGKKNKVFVNALNGINLTFPDKGINFILGKSGCGKTTLLNILAGIDTCTDGSIFYAGKSLNSFKEENFEQYRNEIIGSIYQEYHLIPYYSVGENVKLVLDMKQDGKTEEEKIALVNEYLKKVDLVDERGATLYNRSISELSGGQKQRVAIARAIIKQPKVILADEPTGALDYQTGKDIFHLLKEISSQCLVIVVTHDEEFAHAYGDRVIRMQDGKIIDDQVKTQVYVKEEIKDVSACSAGELSFKHCLKMGTVALTKKRLRLTLSLMCSILALLLLGVATINISLDTTSAYLQSAYDKNTSYVIFNWNYEFIEESNPNNEHVEEWCSVQEIMESKVNIWKDYGARPIYPSEIYSAPTYPLSYSEMVVDMSADDGSPNYCLETVQDSHGMIEIDESLNLQADERFINKALCRYPTRVNEVAISDIKADIYIKYGFIDADGISHNIYKPDDLIGLKISDNYTICGVFSTPDSELLRNNPYSNETYESECAIRCVNNSILNYWYVCPNFFELKGGKNPTGFLLPLEKGYFSDINFFKKLDFQEGDYRFYPELLSIYGFRVNVWQSFIEEYNSLVIGLSIAFTVFSILLTFNYLVGSIGDRKREFGILLSLGASKRSIRNVFLTECIITAIIEFLVAYCSLWIICLALNLAIFKMPYFLVGWFSGLIILFCSIFVTFIATLFSLQSINSLTPKNIIAVADK